MAAPNPVNTNFNGLSGAQVCNILTSNFQNLANGSALLDCAVDSRVVCLNNYNRDLSLSNYGVQPGIATLLTDTFTAQASSTLFVWFRVTMTPVIPGNRIYIFTMNIDGTPAAIVALNSDYAVYTNGVDISHINVTAGPHVITITEQSGGGAATSINAGLEWGIIEI